MGSRKKQLGATLLEALAALAIIGGVMVLANNLTNDYSTNQRSAVTAQYVTTVGNAAQAYIKDNYAALTAAATAAVPAVVTVPMLVSTNYLTTGFSSTNNHNQTACVLVLQPTANNLQALVITEGGNTIDDLTLGQIAATVGAAGGGIYSTATTTVKGAMGGWSFAVGNYANSATHCDGSAGAAVLAAGHPMEAIWFNNGSLATAYLYRNSVAGHPELNTMNTPLIMSSTQTTGTACTTTGAIAQDGSGAVISCQGGTWKIQGSAYWKDPVANFASLPVCNASSIWQTRIAETPTVGTGPRAYTCDGTNWRAVALDNNGRLYAGGYAAGSADINSYSMEIGGPNPTTTNNEGKLYLHHHGVIGHQLRYNSGTLSLEAAGNGYGTNNNPNFSTGTAQINTVVVENTACPSNGLVARDATGLLLSCQSGVWKKASGSGGGFSAVSFYADWRWINSLLVDVGWHKLCVLSALVQNSFVHLVPVAGPDANGWFSWQYWSGYDGSIVICYR